VLLQEEAPDPILLRRALERLQAHLKRQSFQAKYRGVELEALYDVGLAITRTLNLEQLTEEILLRAVSLLDARRGALYQLQDEEQYRLRRAVGGQAASQIDAAQPEVVRLLADGRTHSEQGAGALLPGADHLAAVSIEIEGGPWGLLVVADKERRHGVGPFSESDHRTLGLFGHQAAIAIENAQLHQQALEKQKLERDMELAAEIQRQLLPKALPLVEGYAVGGWNRPARQVGGDYYDLRLLDDDRLLLVLGDVTGKGMPAALLVSTLHSALRLMVPRRDLGPAFFTRLNEHLLEISPINKFITLVMAELDLKSGRLRSLNAGHNPALLLRRGGAVEEIPSSGPPLGLLEDSHYQVAEHHLAPGDLLCFYSDGLTEATAPATKGKEEEEFGLHRLSLHLEAHRHLPPAEIRYQLDNALARFTGGRPQGDDQTMILVRREAPT
jgi:sigma-B regulation protein RsbU (phosphoserine phosphatase)